jgi:hypothetical protein
MSHASPYTKEELNTMSDKEFVELFKNKSPPLHPWCLIGKPLSDVRKTMTEWNKHSCILVSGLDGCFMDMRINYYYCDVDKIIS